MVEAAVRLRSILSDEGLDSWPKLTGDESLHVMVPITPDLTWGAALDFSRGIAERLAATKPARYALSARNQPAGTVLIDYLRNGRGATAIGAYSPRALIGFPIAMPTTWEALEGAAPPTGATIATVPPMRPKSRPMTVA